MRAHGNTMSEVGSAAAASGHQVLARLQLFSEPVEPHVISAWSGVLKGDSASMCALIRYGLSSPRAQPLCTHLRSKGLMNLNTTPVPDAKYIDMLLRLAAMEFGWGLRVASEDLVTQGSAEKKKQFVIDFLTATGKRCDEFEKETSVQAPKELKRRPRSFSAGSEYSSRPPGLNTRRHPRGEDDALPDSRIFGPPMTRLGANEPWIQPPGSPSIYSYPSPRTPYQARPNSSLSSGPVTNLNAGAQRDDESFLGGRLHNGGSEEDSQTLQHTPTLRNSKLLPPSRLSLLQTSEEDILNGSRTKPDANSPAINSIKIMSPHRKAITPGSNGASPLASNFGRRNTRLEFADDDAAAGTSASSPNGFTRQISAQTQLQHQPRASPVDVTIDLADRLSRLEARLDTEFASINERFSKLEKAVTDLCKLLTLQQESSPQRRYSSLIVEDQH